MDRSQQIKENIAKINNSLAGTEQFISNKQRDIVEQDQLSNSLGSQLENIATEESSKSATLQELQRQQEQVFEALYACQQNEINSIAKLQQEQTAISAELDRELSELAVERHNTYAELQSLLYDESREKENAEAHLLAAYTQAHDKLISLETQFDQNKQDLHADCLTKINELNELHPLSAQQLASARLDIKAVEKSISITERNLAEINSEHEKAALDIQNWQEQLSFLNDERRTQAESLAKQAASAQEQAALAAEQAQQLKTEQSAEYVKAADLARIARTAYLTAEEEAAAKGDQLKQMLDNVDSDASRFAMQINKLMDDVVQKRSNARKAEQAALDLLQKVEEDEEHQRGIEKRVARLKAEALELTNISIATAELAKEATASRLSASTDISAAMYEIEKALLLSAQEAAEDAERANKSLREAEQELADAALLLQQKNEQAAKAATLAETAQKVCQNAEQVLYEYSTQIESREMGSKSPLILAAQEEYQNLLDKALELKKAAEEASSELRQLRDQTEAAIAASAEEQKEQQATANVCSKQALEIDADFQQKIITVEAELKIAEEKHRSTGESAEVLMQKIDELQAELVQKQQALLELEAAIAGQEQDIEIAVQREKQLFDEQVLALEEEIVTARQAADDAMSAYNNALVTAMQATRQAITCRERLLQIEKQQKAKVRQAEQQKRTDAAELAQQMQLLAAQTAAAQQQALSITEEIEQLHQNIAQLQNSQKELAAKQNVARSRVEIRTAEQEELKKTLAELNEELQKEEAALELALQEEAARAEEERLRQDQLEQAQASAQQQAAEEEKLRLNSVTEAARAEALAEQKRIAALREDDDRKAEYQAMQLAQGQVLSEQENLLLISNDQLQQRVNRMKELLREELLQNGSYRLPENELPEHPEVEQAEEARAKSYRMFNTARTIANNINERIEKTQELRQSQGLVLAGCLAERDRACAEQEKLQSIIQQTTESESDLPQGESSTVIAELLVALESTLAQADERVELCQRKLQQSQLDIERTDKKLDNLLAQLGEAQNMLQDLACAWIFNENAALRAKYTDSQRAATVEAAPLEEEVPAFEEELPTNEEEAVAEPAQEPVLHDLLQNVVDELDETAADDAEDDAEETADNIIKVSIKDIEDADYVSTSTELSPEDEAAELAAEAAAAAELEQAAVAGEKRRFGFGFFRKR